MDNWIRLTVLGLTAGSWHLQYSVSPHGLRVAECGHGYPPGDRLETRRFDDPPPAGDTCHACHEGYRGLAHFQAATVHPEP